MATNLFEVEPLRGHHPEVGLLLASGGFTSETSRSKPYPGKPHREVIALAGRFAAAEATGYGSFLAPVVGRFLGGGGTFCGG